jgi:two-component system nitrate/nitrite sensor histidine kinase NarX
MLFLRERVDSDQGFLSILEAMLCRFERNWGIKTELLMDSNIVTHHGIFLSSHVEMQLIRIVQEALMNIRRHAKAHTVTIKVSKYVDSLIITIIDDGIGFRLEDIPQESLGLHIIRERASSFGAMVRIDSTEGVGTTLKIELPNEEGALY